MGKRINFQSVQIDYPKKLYFAAIWIFGKEKKDKMLYFIPKLHKNLTELRKHFRILVEGFNKKSEDRIALDYALVIRLKFIKNSPLKKEMWTKNAYKLENLSQNLSYINMLEKKDFYNIIVTPIIPKKGFKIEETLFFSAFNALKSASDLEIEALMIGSDMYVPPEAKNAGIYSMEEKFGYGIIDGKKFVNKEKTSVN